MGMLNAPASPAPPFCPRPTCRFHRGDTRLWRYVKIGFYPRLAPPHVVQRYRCVTCRRQFGDQTFRVTYWMKRPELLEPVFYRITAGSGFRQIARETRASHQTIARTSGRLGRHALLFHELRRPRGPIEETLTLDWRRAGETTSLGRQSPRSSAAKRHWLLIEAVFSSLSNARVVRSANRLRRLKRTGRFKSAETRIRETRVAVARSSELAR